MKKVLFSAMIIATMVSCSKSETENPVGPEGTNEIRLSAGIAGTKAAVDGDVAVSDLQFLRADATATTPTSFAGKTAFGGSRAVGGVITFDNKQYYGQTDNAYFVSYYPAGTVNSDVVTWTIDGKTDVMTAAVIDAGTQALHAAPGSFAYKHQLSQVEVIISGEVGSAARWGDVTSIKLKNTAPSMTYSYATMTTATAGTASASALVAPDYTADFTTVAVPDAAATTVVAAGMFMPSASQTIALEVAFANGAETAGTRSVIVDLGTGNSLTIGKKHTITLTFKATPSGDEIVVSSTIDTWDTGHTGAGDIN